MTFTRTLASLLSSPKTMQDCVYRAPAALPALATSLPGLSHSDRVNHPAHAWTNCVYCLHLTSTTTRKRQDGLTDFQARSGSKQSNSR